MNQRVYWVYLQEYGRGVSYQSQDNSTAAASWKVHPCMDDNSWKLQPWHSLHDLQKSQVSSWWLHLLQAAQLVRAAPPSRCLSLASRTSGKGSLKLFRCQFSQTYDVCLLPESHEPSHPGSTWTRHSKWEEIVTQSTTIAMTLVQTPSISYLMMRGWKTFSLRSGQEQEFCFLPETFNATLRTVTSYAACNILHNWHIRYPNPLLDGQNLMCSYLTIWRAATTK